MQRRSVTLLKESVMQVWTILIGVEDEGWSSVRIKTICVLFLVTLASPQTHTASLNRLILNSREMVSHHKGKTSHSGNSF